jgi:flagellar protein FlaG
MRCCFRRFCQISSTDVKNTGAIMSNISSNMSLPIQGVLGPRSALPVASSVPLVAPALVAAAQPQPAVQSKPGAEPAKTEPTPEQLKHATEELQRKVGELAPDLQFSVDQSSGQSIIKFTDKTTNEVIRQYPSKDILHLNQVLASLQIGFVVNKKA